MFSVDAWRACDPKRMRDREWTNREEEKSERLNPRWNTWRQIVCDVGCEIALAGDDARARVMQGLAA